MKKTAFLLLLSAWVLCASAQAPKLYIHIVSHNEPTDKLDMPPGINYFKAKSNVLQMAAIIDSKNAKWNLQTSDGFVVGALNFDAAGTASTDVFEILANPPYNDNIEIDPRSKNSGGRNIADQWYLLDSIGAQPTTTVGGFLWYICEPSALEPDWWQFQDTLTGAVFGNKIKFDLLSGAGSAGNTLHCNDLNDFGIFKPDTIDNFYQHNPERNAWCIGTGCAPVLDSLSDEQAIIDLIQSQVDSIQNGLWPADKFYVTRIMTNQREYGPLFFQKIAKVIDSLNQIPAAQLEWATIREMFSTFQNWQQTSGLDYSQWRCDRAASGVGTSPESHSYRVYPNPFHQIFTVEFSDARPHVVVLYDALGRVLVQEQAQTQAVIDMKTFPGEIFFLKIDGFTTKLVRH